MRNSFVNAAICVTVTVVAVAFAGCAPFTSWPQVESGVRMDPMSEPLPTLMTDAILYAHNEFEPGMEIVLYNLPERTPPSVYDKIDRNLGDSAPLIYAGDVAVHIEAVRARGTSAEVDMIVPRAEGRYELVTVYFHHSAFKGWQFRDARRWRIPRDPPPPYYVPLPEVAVADADADVVAETVIETEPGDETVTEITEITEITDVTEVTEVVVETATDAEGS